MIRAARVAAALLTLSVSAASAQDRDFDFYVLALSWSPTWCATAASASASEQCADGSGFGFVVHGLWPQYEKGYPEFCASGGRLARPLVDAMLDIMPDADLVRHEWRKHGTCTGLRPEDYFAETRAAFARVRVPPAFLQATEDRAVSAASVEAAFVAVNPDLAADAIAVACSDGWLEDVRICLDRDLAFRGCREVDMRGCRQRNLRLPASD